MISFFCLIQIIFGSSGYDLFLMSDIMDQHIQKVHDLWFIVHKSQHDHTKGILHLCMLIQLVHDHIGISITSELYDNPHTLSV